MNTNNNSCICAMQSLKTIIFLIAFLLPIAWAMPALAQENTDNEVTNSLMPILRRIFQDDEEQDPPTISRGDLCLVSPAIASEDPAIWHTEPTLIWQGTVGKVDLLEIATDTVLWESTPAETETQLSYEGDEPLRSGRRYRWRLYDPTNLDSPAVFADFTLLSSIIRQLVANGLAASEQQTAEQNIAIDHARYFAFRDLPTDAIQSLFTVENPTTDLQAAQAEIVERRCQS